MLFMKNKIYCLIKTIPVSLIVINLILKLMLYFIMGPSSPIVDDGTDYYQIAYNLLYHQEFSGIFGITSVRAPGYPFFLAFLYFLSFGNVALIRFLQILLSLLMFPLICAYMNKIKTPKRIKILTLIIFTFYPVFIYLPFRLLTENLFIILLMLFSFFFVRYKKSKDLILCGIIAGLLSLTRPMFILYPFFSILYLYFYQEKCIKAVIRDFFILMLFTCLTISPWVIRNYALWGDFCLITTNSGHTILINNNDLLFDIKGPAPQNRVFKMELLHPDFMPGTEKWDSMNELERDKELQKRAFKWIMNNPVKFLRLIPVKLWSFWHYSQNPKTPQISKNIQNIGSMLSYLLILPFIAAGFLISLKRPLMYHDLYPLSLLLLFLFTTIIFGGSLRFRLPLEIFLIIWGAKGLHHFLRKIL